MNEQHLSDDKNPAFLFSITDTQLLVKIVNNQIDAKQFAQEELRKRGLDDNGIWIGFEPGA